MHHPPASLLRARVVRAVALALAVTVAIATQAGSAAGAAGDGGEAARQQREEVRQQRALLAAELDVLHADDAAVGAALDTLEANTAAAQRALTTATADAEAARGREHQARAVEAAATVELGKLDAELRALAIGAFIGGGDTGVDDLARFVSAEDVGEAARMSYLAALEVERRDAVAERFARVRTAHEAALLEAQDATLDAAAVVEELTIQVAALDEARALQASFVAQVEAELERRLAEAAALDQLDVALGAEIRREEAALAARLAEEAATRAEAAARAEAERAAAARAIGEGGAVGPIQHRPSSGRPQTLPVGSGTLVRVGTFVVDSSIGDDVAAMLNAAAADGFVFGGGAYRDANAQIELRRAHCGPTDHDIWQKPASACRPPTARPGHSMHEVGLAMDLTLDGALITRRSNPGFIWLAANAGRFGFRNLPSEPWHWSTTGG